MVTVVVDSMARMVSDSMVVVDSTTVVIVGCPMVSLYQLSRSDCIGGCLLFWSRWRSFGLCLCLCLFLRILDNDLVGFDLVLE